MPERGSTPKRVTVEPAAVERAVASEVDVVVSADTSAVAPTDASSSSSSELRDVVTALDAERRTVRGRLRAVCPSSAALWSAVPYAIMVLAQLLWSVNTVFSKYNLQYLSPFVHLSSRYVFGCAALLVIVAVQRREREQFAHIARHPRQHWPLLLLLGMLNAGNQMFGAVGIRLTSASDAAMIQPTTAIIAMLLAFALKREPRSWQKVVACFLTVFGAISIVLAESLLSSSSQSSSELSPAQRFGGICLFLVNSSFMAIYLTVQKPLLMRADAPSAVNVTAWSFLLASPFVYASAIPTATDLDQPLPALVFVGFVYCGVFGTGVVFALYSYVNKVLGSSITAMGQSLQALITVILSVVFLGESVTWLHAVGGLLVAGGMILAVRTRHRELEAEAAERDAALKRTADSAATAPAADTNGLALPNLYRTHSDLIADQPQTPMVRASSADASDDARKPHFAFPASPPPPQSPDAADAQTPDTNSPVGSPPGATDSEPELPRPPLQWATSEYITRNDSHHAIGAAADESGVLSDVTPTLVALPPPPHRQISSLA